MRPRAAIVAVSCLATCLAATAADADVDVEGCSPKAHWIGPYPRGDERVLNLEAVQAFKDGSAFAAGFEPATEDRPGSIVGLLWDRTQWVPAGTLATDSNWGAIVAAGRSPDHVTVAWTDRVDAGAGPSIVRAAVWNGSVLKDLGVPTDEGQVLYDGDVAGGQTWLLARDDYADTFPYAYRPRSFVLRNVAGSWERLRVPALGEWESVAARYVAAIARDDVWIAGDASTMDRSGPFLFHWDGGRWSDRSSSLPPHSPVTDLDAAPDGAVWMLADPPNDGRSYNSHPLRWTGTEWRWITRGWDSAKRDPGYYEYPVTIAAVSFKEAWVGGFAYSPGASGRWDLAVWNGSRWSAVLTKTRRAAIGSAPSALSVTGAGQPILVGSFRARRADRPGAVTVCPLPITGADLVPRVIHARISNPEPSTSVAWRVSPTNPGPARLVDRSGLALFDSGKLEPGQAFAFTYPHAAGTYRYAELRSERTGIVVVPVVIYPNGDTSFYFHWGASPYEGLWAWDVQVKPPGSRDWQATFSATSHTAGYYDALDGPGIYEVRARTIHTMNGAKSEWSPARSFEVTTGPETG